MISICDCLGSCKSPHLNQGRSIHDFCRDVISLSGSTENDTRLRHLVLSANPNYPAYNHIPCPKPRRPFQMQPLLLRIKAQVVKEQGVTRERGQDLVLFLGN